ncbi:MAG: chorismate mutase [Candidatus Altiarchaeota archaeon]|nr:chorismate mutase [Candidatus Altiarchaeota archaeon]
MPERGGSQPQGENLIEDSEVRRIRKEVDVLDSELIGLLAKRRDLAIQMGKIKRRKHLPIVDGKRNEEVLERVIGEAKKYGLDEKKVEEFWKCIIKCAIEEQERLDFVD